MRDALDVHNLNFALQEDVVNATGNGGGGTATP